MTRFGVPGFNIDPLSYGDIRRPVVPLVQAPRRPTVTDKKFALFTIWRTNKFFSGTEGEIWVLIRFESNGDATWVMISGAAGSITELRADDGNVASPAAGIIDVDGNIVANATHPQPLFTRADVANTVDIDLQIATTVTPTPGDPNDAGIASFNENHFTIDPTSGMVSLSGGGIAADQFDVDANTPPGTDPVIPDGSGEVGIFGALVAAHSVPIETHSRAANQFNIEPQIASAVASSTLSANGMSHYDSAAFTVDADGFVQLVGGGTPAISFETDDGAPNVVPNGSGEIEIVGGANVTTSGQGPGNTITIDASGFASFTCLEVTMDTDPIVPFTGYVANSGSAINLTLPTTSAFGDMFFIVRKGTGNVSILQNAGQTIHYNGVSTTTGASGSLDSNAQWDVIWIKTVTADTDFVVLNSSGSWTAN